MVRTLRLAEAAIMAADGGIPSEVAADELRLEPEARAGHGRRS